MNELPDDHAFKRIIGDKHFDIHRLVRLYDIIKKEELDINTIIQQVKRYVEEKCISTVNINIKNLRTKLKATYFDPNPNSSRNIEALETFDRYVEKYMHHGCLITMICWSM